MMCRHPSTPPRSEKIGEDVVDTIPYAAKKAFPFSALFPISSMAVQIWTRNMNLFSCVIQWSVMVSHDCYGTPVSTFGARRLYRML